MRIIKLFYIICVFMLGFSPTFSQTLRESVQQAMALHPEIQQNRAQTQAARQGISEAQGAYYPKVDLNSTYGNEWTQSPFTRDLAGSTSTSLYRREFNVAVVQNIYSGGAVVGEVDRNIFIFHSQDFRTMAVINDIALGVTEAYLDILLQDELVRIAQKNLAEHLRLLNLIRERSVAGIARAAELDQGESRYSLAEANLISAQGNQREARVRFTKLVGTWPEKLASPPIPDEVALPQSLDKAIKEGFDNHPRIRAACEDIKQAEAQRKISKASFFPKVDAVFTASRNNNLDGVPGVNNDNVGLIRVSYNAFNGGGDLSHLKKTAYQVQEAFESRTKAMIELKEKIQLDYNSWYANKRRVTALASYVVSIEKTKMAYFEQFQIGQRTFLDLLNSQNEMYRSRVDYLQSRKDEINARYRILNSVGRLIPYFARQREENRYGSPLFTLPKPTKKIAAASVTQAAPLNALQGQMLYPTGKTSLLPAPGKSSDAPVSPASLPSVVPSISGSLPATKNPAPKTAINKVTYLIELSQFKNPYEVKDVIISLSKKKLPTKVVTDGNTTHVLVGPFSTVYQANKVLDEIIYFEKMPGIVREVTVKDNLNETPQ